MSNNDYTPRMAFKVSAVVQEDGELRLKLPLAPGQAVVVFVLAEGGTPEPEHVAAQSVVASDTAPRSASSDDGADPRQVSEMLRHLSDEIIEQYESLFGIERNSDTADKTPD